MIVKQINNLLIKMIRTSSSKQSRKKIFSYGFIILSLIFSMIGIFLSNGAIFTVGLNENEIDYDGMQSEIEYSDQNNRNEEWHEEKYEMIIITRDQTDEIAEMERLAEWKTKKGVPTKIVNQTEFMSYEGNDVPEKIRNCIIDYYLTYGIKWVLIAGDTHLIPIRYSYNPDTVLLTTFSEPRGSQSLKPTDYYYADLTGNWDEDGDGVYGESAKYNSNGRDELDWTPEVYVGRFPGVDAAELATMVNKTIYYENMSSAGDWIKRITLAGAIQKSITSEDPDGEEEGYLVDQIISESIPSSMTIRKLIETNDPAPPHRVTNLSWNTFYDDKCRAGNSIVFYAGHGAIDKFDKLGAGYDFLYSSDADNMDNYEMPSLFYGDACLTNFFDDESIECLGEHLIKNPRGGAIGFVGGMRLTFFHRDDDWDSVDGVYGDEDQKLCEMNRGMSRLFFMKMFQDGYYQQGKALYEMKRDYVNSWWWMTDNPWDGAYDIDTGEQIEYSIHVTEWERKNVLTYNLLGDPETDIYTNFPKSFDQDGTYGGVTGIFSQETPYYEGEKINLVIQDENTNTVADALLCIQGEDGAYDYFESDNGGNIEVILPEGAQNYNFTVSAHNMKTLHGNFSTIEDPNPPVFTSSLSLNPEHPSVDDTIIAQVGAEDGEAEVEAGYLVCSTDGFQSFNYYKMDAYGGATTFRTILPKLDSGRYQYIVFVKDYGNNFNHTIWTSVDVFRIPMPAIAGIVIGANGILFLGVIAYLLKKKDLTKEYERELSLLPE
ncbi:MAG: hypothetical protein GF364_15365 [Candidatus Lokiarchaeota archaeon]|nr:hypothetical protein [Candidatus Lokiarchaeota archaeon]